MKILLFIVYAIVLSAGLARRGVSSTSMSSATTAANPPKRLLIVGATGGTGRELVAQALARGYSVRALVRDTSKLKVKQKTKLGLAWREVTALLVAPIIPSLIYCATHAVTPDYAKK